MYPTPFTAFRVITHDSIVVLYLDDGRWSPSLEPENYMPVYEDGVLWSGDIQISTIPDLAAALFLVLDDSIDYIALRDTLLLLADQISVREYCEKAQNFSCSGFINAFSKTDFEKVVDKVNDPEGIDSKDAVASEVIKVMERRQPAFSIAIAPFVDFIKNVSDIHEIEFIDIVEGYVEENDIADNSLEEKARLEL